MEIKQLNYLKIDIEKVKQEKTGKNYLEYYIIQKQYIIFGYLKED